MRISESRHRRLLWTLWIVVVVPTALLGTLAARTVKTRETLLRQQFAETAGEALSAVTLQVRDTLDRNVVQLATAMATTIDTTGTYEHIARTAMQIAETNAIIASVVVFMSPWGFVYPAESAAGQRAEAVTSLAEVFNQALSAGRQPGRTWFAARHADKTYVLSGIPGRPNLVAGFQISEPAVLDMVERLLADLRNRRYQIRIEATTPDAGARWRQEPRQVTISDSLDSGSITVSPTGTAIWQSLDDGVTLASADLPSPLEHIQVTISHPGAAGATSIRLWNVAFQGGILLLAGIICGGTAVVLRDAFRLASESRRRSELVAGMSHDLKTPVTSMRMMAEGLSGGHITDPEKQQRCLKTITRECERLGDVVDRILFFLRRDSETVRFADQRVDTPDLITACAETFRERMGERVELTVEVSPATPSVRGDPDALAKVVGNLLDNAAKYGITPQDRRVTLSAELQQRHKHRTAVIRVSDHGPGIPAGEQRRVFERFYRVPSAAHSHVGGIGLGLALCHDIIRAHRGHIDISTGPRGGCVFSVTLPADTGTGRHG